MAAGSGANHTQSPVDMARLSASPAQEALAVRASKKLQNDELLLTSFAATRLRMELDRIPLWRGDHVSVKQLAEDFARYLYLPRLKESSVLLGAISDGISLLTWEQEGFAYADSYDEDAGRYLGLRYGQIISLTDASSPSLLVKGAIARKQIESEIPTPPPGPGPIPPPPGPGPNTSPSGAYIPYSFSWQCPIERNSCWPRCQ